MTVAANNRLSDGRQMRAMEGTVTQVQMFQLRGKFDPKTEHIARVKDVDDALNISRIYTAVMGNRWVRTDEYGVYHRNPEAPLGKELLWIENGVLFRKIIPDVPVQFGGKEISLQKVAGGMGVYDSIGLLQIVQTDEKEFTVSAIDLAALAGKVRAMRFMMNGWAETDSHGFPDANKPTSSANTAARYGWVRTEFDKKATGSHGSLARLVDGYGGDYRRDVGAGGLWSNASGVAIVGRDANVAKGNIAPIVRGVEQSGAAAPLETAVPVSPTSGLQLTRNPDELIVRGSPEQLDAAMRLLHSLKQ
ncbi:MAG: hypothetical protein V1861_00705 [Candidatus Micrarchaeota archaeon]